MNVKQHWTLTPFNITNNVTGESHPIETAPKQFLIEFCQWNDGNGCWTDEQCQLEFQQDCDVQALRTIVREWALEL